MIFRLSLLMAILFILSLEIQADCISGEELRKNSDIVITGQTSYVHKNDSIWRISGRNPYTTDNRYNDIAIKLTSACAIVTNKLDADFSFYGLGYYPVLSVGAFEKDNHRARILIENLRLSYTLSDSMRLEGGKMINQKGAFFLKSPATLLTSFYAAFKPTRLYDPAMRTAYSESFWGGRLIMEHPNYAISLTVSPKLASIDKYYESSGNWSANERSNSQERYLLTYTDYRSSEHSPSLSVMLGDAPAIALADSYNYTSQLLFNAEIAFHATQQWRHLSGEKVDEVKAWQFPSSLYSQQDKKGVDLALGAQYTTDRFNVFGLEYYIQSEGYSKSEWQDQTDFIKYLNKPTGIDSLNNIFDNYKYLMASEISNTSNKGMLQGKHYLNAYASFQYKEGSSIQPYLIMNLVDSSTLVGMHYARPLKGLNDKAEMYTGFYSAIGSEDSEFSLYGETIGIYAGFKYHL